MPSNSMPQAVLNSSCLLPTSLVPNDVAISVENLSKAYRIWESPSARLTTPIQAGLASLLPARSGPAKWLKDRASATYRDFYALKDVSFSVGRGESVGIIGRNGSGKSTLLQIIAGTMQPTKGIVRVKGRVAALLELGSGFNPEFTGRENVYLNAAVLGLTRTETDACFDDIASFADIGEFLDQPIKTYSSGMQLRIAFAVATAVKPDVLIVDEALSVGDVFFQQKASKRIRNVIESGTTFLLVSHDPTAVRTLTRQALLLHEGSTAYFGASDEAVSRYFLKHGRAPLLSAPPIQSAVLPIKRHFSAKTRERIISSNILSKAKSRIGERGLTVVAASIIMEGVAGWLSGPIGATLQIEVIVQAHRKVDQPNINIHLYDRFFNLIFAAHSQQVGTGLGSLVQGDEIAARMSVVMCVQPGQYTFDIGVGESIPGSPNNGEAQDRHLGLGPVSIIHNLEEAVPFHGMAQLPMAVTIIE